MDRMEILDAEMQMMVLQDDVLEEREEEKSDEVEDLSNSLRAAVDDGAVKPKLHCLMIDPSFSMVTVQSEDSGIVWETASSRCSTPWTSEINTPAYEPCSTHTCSAGKIIFIMDEEQITRRRRRKDRPAQIKTHSHISHEFISEAQRPAMVEVSLPNIRPAEEHEQHKSPDPKEERHQRLFSLVSEGSEILNIIVPPKVSTVDEEESKGLEDHLFYLEETPAVKSAEIPDDPDTADRHIYSDTGETPAEKSVSTLSVTPISAEPSVQLTTMRASMRGATTEDYFEKFTLLDNRTQSGDVLEETELLETEEPTEQTDTDKDTHHPDVEPRSEALGGSLAVSMLDITGDHLDEVFYGGDVESHGQSAAESVREKEREFSKSSLKESGAALFGSEESVLTPIYLPEGPPKIIDPNLLEEPKAMPFLYSDLYADAVGSRKKQDEDAESMTSEKSFHSQESETEDRGYLEKFVLKVETVAHDGDLRPEVKNQERSDSFRLAGYVYQHKTEEESEGAEPEEITDFFRNSASSSPCEPIDLESLEEEPEAVRTPVVTFKDEVTQYKTEEEENHSLIFTDDTDFEEAFLPVEISDDSPAWEENLPTARNTKQLTSTRTDQPTHKPKRTQTSTVTPTPSQNKITIGPVIPRHKPFLDLTPLLPAETPETESEEKPDDRSSDGPENDRSSKTKEEEKTAEDLDYDVIGDHEVRESSLADVRTEISERDGCENNGFTIVEPPNPLDYSHEHTEADYEIVDALDKTAASLNESE